MKKALLAILLAAVILLPVDPPDRSNAFPNTDKQHAMLRLEDVSPGASYATAEGLGKLRAVLEYLQAQNVPYHVALIPRSKSLQPDGSWYEKGIDDPTPDEHVTQFISLMQQAERSGAVIGMHGYTHQYGDVKRPDNHQNTGTGNEFDLEDVPETQTEAYAVSRISKSLAAFEKAQLTPAFWESPHYNDTREQEEVFRSYMGILYQPDLRSLRSFFDLIYYEETNTTARETLGSVYVPAPLRYIHNAESVERLLDKLPAYRGLAAMYYHPYMEFPFLEPVPDAAGRPQMRDGLPEYRYADGTLSNLQRLVEGFRRADYTWQSLHDIVPFTPAHRVGLPLGTKPDELLLGNVDGDGGAEVITRSGDRVEVYQNRYTWPRNQVPKRARGWLTEPFAPEESLSLHDVNGDGSQDLLAYNADTGLLRWFPSDKTRFLAPRTLVQLPSHADEVHIGSFDSDAHDDILLRTGDQLDLLFWKKGSWEVPRGVMKVPAGGDMLVGDFNGDRKLEPAFHLPEEQKVQLYRNLGGNSFRQEGEVTYAKPATGAQVLVGDTDGNGLADLVFYDPKHGLWDVRAADKSAHLKPLPNLFGPWARGEHRAFLADFDGNGKADIAAFAVESQSLLDLALSFRRAR